MRCSDAFFRTIRWSLAPQRTGGESWRKCVFAAPRDRVYPGGRRRCCCRRCHSLCRHSLAAAVPVPPPGTPLLSRWHRVPRPEDPKARKTRGCLRNCDTGAPAGPGAAGVSAGSRARACGAGAGVASSASRSSGLPFPDRLPRRPPRAGLEPRRAPPAMSPDWRWPVSAGRVRAAVAVEKGPPWRGALSTSWTPRAGRIDRPFVRGERPRRQCVSFESAWASGKRETLFDLLHFDEKEAAQHPGDPSPHHGPGPTPCPLLPSAPALPGSRCFLHTSGPRAFRAKFWSHLCAFDTRSLGTLFQFGNQASKAKAAAFTRDPAWKELSLFVPVIALVFKGTAAGRK